MFRLREPFNTNRKNWIRALRAAMPDVRVEPSDMGSIAIYPAGAEPVRYYGWNPKDPLDYDWADYGDYRGRVFGFHAVDGPVMINTWAPDDFKGVAHAVPVLSSKKLLVDPEPRMRKP